MNEIIDFLQYSFVQRAFLAGIFVAITCAALGMFLVLRKMSLIGDGLSHVSFGAIALGLVFGGSPFYLAVPVVILGSLLILKISEKAKVYGDAAIGIVSAIGISGGVMLASLSNGYNVDLFSYLFGNILATSRVEVIFSIILSFLVLILLYLFYWDLFSATFDEEYAKTTGVRTNFINLLLVVMTAITVVLSIKMVGVMLVSALLILPAVSALQFSKGLGMAIFFSIAFSVTSVIFGIALSFFLDLPTGATVVLLNILLFVLSYSYRQIRF